MDSFPCLHILHSRWFSRTVLRSLLQFPGNVIQREIHADRTDDVTDDGLTDEHKAAMAKGRRQARAVRDYLEALEYERRPGRPITRDSLQERIQKYHREIEEEEDPATRVDLIQKRLDAEEQLKELNDRPDLDALEQEFKKVVEDYSERKGISYTAWREAGVPAAVLRDAGVPRTRRTS